MTREEEIEAILVDTYSDDEADASWGAAFEDDVAVPFDATLVGTPVTVLGFRTANSGTIQCRVRRESRERWVSVEDLDEKGLPEDMGHLLSLYRYWKGGGG